MGKTQFLQDHRDTRKSMKVNGMCIRLRDMHEAKRHVYEAEGHVHEAEDMGI